MMLYVLIGLILASFVFAFLSARTWHWGYVVLVEAIFLATVVLFLFAGETLRITAILRTENNKLQKQFDETSQNNEGLNAGTNDPSVLNRLRATDPPTKMAEDATSIPSIQDLDHELLLAARLRGSVWRNVVPAGPVDPATGAVSIKILSPPKPAPPAGEAPAEGTPAPAAAPAAVPSPPKADSVVYLFEDPVQPVPAGQKGGPQYLGEFNVVKSAAAQATLQPVNPLDPKDFELRRLAASKGPWIMYETMPMDRYDIFTGMTEEQLKQLMPKQSVTEYVRHDKEATADDDPFRKLGLNADGKPLPPEEIAKAAKVLYQRRLRDYAAEFDELDRRRVAMKADKDAVEKDIAQLNSAEDIAKKLQAYRTEERQKLTNELAGISKEREAIEKHLADVEKMLAKAQQLTADAIARNRQLAAELAARQLQPPQPPKNGANAPAKRTEPLARTK